MRTVGLIAAAGNSSRMGRPKALLPDTFPDGVPGELFVTRLVTAFQAAGVTEIIITVPAGDVGAAVAAAVGDRAHCLENVAPADGLSGSVATAINAVVDVDALVICPVDVPFATALMIRSLLGAVADGADVAVVVNDGVRGHPVAFAARCFADLLLAGARGGPRSVMAAAARVVEVEVADPRVRLDLNGPGELAHALARTVLAVDVPTK